MLVFIVSFPQMPPKLRSCLKSHHNCLIIFKLFLHKLSKTVHQGKHSLSPVFSLIIYLNNASIIKNTWEIKMYQKLFSLCPKLHWCHLSTCNSLLHVHCVLPRSCPLWRGTVLAAGTESWGYPARLHHTGTGPQTHRCLSLLDHTAQPNLPDALLHICRNRCMERKKKNIQGKWGWGGVGGWHVFHRTCYFEYTVVLCGAHRSYQVLCYSVVC